MQAITKYALWIIALAMMFLGVRFALQQPSSSAEYAAATYVFNDTAHGVTGLQPMSNKGARR